MKIRAFYRKNKKLILLVTMFILLSISLVQSANIEVFADVGNNNRYGGSSSSGGYEDSGDFYVFFMIFDLIFDLFGPIGVFVVAILGYLVYLGLKKTKTSNSVYEAPIVEQPRFYHCESESTIEHSIQEFDPLFSAEDMKQKISECFILLQKAWTERKWEQVRPFESDALFSMHNAQLNDYIRNGTINVVERIKITSTKLIDFEISGDKDVLQVELKAMMKDYIIDANTKEVVEGDKNKDFFTIYRLEFIRSHGSLTQVGKEITTTNCPNCGAPTTVTSSGKCEYCDSIITNGHHGWVLNELTTM